MARKGWARLVLWLISLPLYVVKYASLHERTGQIRQSFVSLLGNQNCSFV